MEENVNIIVNDKIDATIDTKLKSIERTALNADSAVGRLNKALATINTSAISKLSNELNKIDSAATKAALGNERLSQAQARTAITQSNAALAATRATTAVTQQATATQRLTAAQHNAARAALEVAEAEDRAALAALQLKRAQDATNQSTTSLISKLTSLRAILTTIVSAIGLSAFANLTSEFTDLESRVARVAGSAQNATVVFDRLQQMARRTYSEFNATTESFLANQGALQELGYTTQQQLDFTESLNNALVVSGAKADRAMQVQNALSKAMALGTLRGENLNSVIQVGGRVAELLASQLGTTVNRLRALGAQGKITGDVIYKALVGNLELVRKEADEMPATINDGLMLVRQALANTVTSFDKFFGISAGVSALLVTIADNFGIVQVAIAGVGTALLLHFGSSMLSTLAKATRAMWTFNLAVMANPLVALATVLVMVTAAVYAFGDSITIVSDKNISLLDGVKAAFSYVADYAGWFFGWLQTAWNTTVNYLNEKIKEYSDTFEGVFDVILKSVKIFYNTIIASHVASFRVIQNLIRGWPVAFEVAFVSITNLAADAAETMINSFTWATQKIVGLASGLAPEMTARLQASLEENKIRLPRAELSEEARNWSDALWQDVKGAFDEDYIGDFFNDWLQRAEAISKARREAGDLSGGAGKPQLPEPSKNAKEAAKILANFNKELEQEFKLLQLLAPAREVEQRLMQLQNQLAEKGVSLAPREIEVLRQKLYLNQQMAGVSRELDSIYSETVGAMEQLTFKQLALNQAYSTGMISLEQYSQKANQLGLEVLSLNLQMGNGSFADAMTLGLGQVISQYENVLTSLSQSFGNFFTTISDGFSDSIGRAIVQGESLRQTFANVAQQGVQQLISSIVKLGVQWALTQALGDTLQKSSLATQTAASVAAGGTVAAAWAPAAAAVSLATQGGNAVPAALGIKSVNTLSMMMAKIGFRNGGYTGNGAESEIAGVVHGKEYVMTASTVRRVGRDNLDAIQSGAPVSSVASTASYSGGGGGNGTNVVVVKPTIINNMPSDAQVSVSAYDDGNGGIDMQILVEQVKGELVRGVNSGNDELLDAMSTQLGTTQKARGRN